MSARLHVMLGEGGVGKTTLAAGYAIALAARGRNVALLGIDPARRLQSALGLPLGDGAVRVPLAAAGELHAAVLSPESTLRRWATEGIPRHADRERLLQNKLFAAMADRLATTTDVIAAVRIAEWMEREPAIGDFVVDTAPGRNGLEFLTRPSALVALMKGRLLGWLREPRGLGRRVVRGLSHLGGAPLLAELGELSSFALSAFERVLARLERAEEWVGDPSTEVLLVTAVREDAALQNRALRAALAQAGLAPAAVVVNRALPSALEAEIAGVELAPLDEPARAIVRYARAYSELQSRVLRESSSLVARVVRVSAATGLDGADRLELLGALGDELARALTSSAA